ncbi:MULTISPECIES: hypothetical protein [unclassified Actinoplanes]|uniref:hypothetical protein n=1 Tax=unclassified Actinoplanes TaxID=2626549 RepID=UPI0012BA9AE7|nr:MULTISPECIES: hypothetical protein [unclassified Actinoplanes]
MLTVGSAAALSAACGQAGGPVATLAGAPHGIVVNRGGVVEVLDDTTTGTVRQVTEQDTGGTSADPLAMTKVRQLAAHTIAGLRAGRLVALDPAHADRPRTVAPASDWFPDTALTGGWAVTESLNQPPCPAIDGTAAGTTRYRLERHDLSTGKTLRTTCRPCGPDPGF